MAKRWDLGGRGSVGKVLILRAQGLEFKSQNPTHTKVGFMMCSYNPSPGRWGRGHTGHSALVVRDPDSTINE